MGMSDSLELLYIEQKSRVTDGSWDRNVLKSSSRRMSKTARRLARCSWKTNRELSPKDRQGNKHVQEVTAYLQWLIDVGYAQRAWDNTGDVFYATHTESIPEWLTQSVNDDDLFILPDRSTCQV